MDINKESLICMHIIQCLQELAGLEQGSSKDCTSSESDLKQDTKIYKTGLQWLPTKSNAEEYKRPFCVLQLQRIQPKATNTPQCLKQVPDEETKESAMED